MVQYDLTGIKNYKTVCLNEDGYLKTVTDVIIFMTTNVGINLITEKNKEKFKKRSWLIQRLYGNLMTLDGTPFYLTNKHIDDHVGLNTNASNMTKAQFMKELDRIATEKVNEGGLKNDSLLFRLKNQKD